MHNEHAYRRNVFDDHGCRRGGGARRDGGVRGRGDAAREYASVAREGRRRDPLPREVGSGVPLRMRLQSSSFRGNKGKPLAWLCRSWRDGAARECP